MKKRIKIQQFVAMSCFAYIPLSMAMDSKPHDFSAKKSGLLSRVTRKTSKDNGKISDTHEQLLQASSGQVVCKVLKTKEHVALSVPSGEKKKRVSRLHTLESLGASEHLKNQLQIMSQEELTPQVQPKFTSLEEGLACLQAQFGCEFSYSQDIGASGNQADLCPEYEELDLLLEHVEKTRATRSAEKLTDAEAAVFFDTILREATPSQEVPVAPEESSLFTAIRSGNLEQLQDLLTQKVNVQVKDAKGATPLHAVLEAELAIPLVIRKAFLELLIRAGASLDEMDEHGKNPVVTAALSVHPDVNQLFVFLYDQQVTAGCIDLEGQTVLHGAVSKGMVEAVEHILNQKKERLEALDFKKHTPLQAAFENNLAPEVKRKLVLMLIKAGADKERVDEDGLPLLFRVIKNVDFVGVQLLLAHGASHRSRNAQNQTALEYAEEKLQVTEHPENARKIYDLLKEYASGKRVPLGQEPIPPHITIAIPENLRGQIDIDTFRDQIRIMVTAKDGDGNSILSKALINSFKEEHHE